MELKKHRKANMNKSKKRLAAVESSEALPLSAGPGNPLVFISHDARDASLAEAFSKLLKSVSAGMIKTFHSSDKKGNEGIAFGEEWYKRLMTELQSTSDVVCLFTERSLDRPWILFEAGVAKGKLNSQVMGVALGVPLSRVSTGPFYQFHNIEDSEADLAKLVHQLAARVPSLELDSDVVKVQVQAFKAAESALLKTLSTGVSRKEAKESVNDETSIAKLVEEMKTLPSRVAERLTEAGEPFRRRRFRRIHPGMLEEMMHMGLPGDPVGILLAASLIRDDAPWLYELAMEVYRTAKSGDPLKIEAEMARLEGLSDFVMRRPFMEEFGLGTKETHMVMMEFPRMLHLMLRRVMREGKPSTRRRTPLNLGDTQTTP
jgi:hypothetical protein